MDLTDAYENGAHIPDSDTFRDSWPVKAAAFRDGANARLNLRYGPADRNLFDIFLPEGEPMGLLVFIHGGYWRATSKDVWSHLAAGPVARGWAVAMPSYTLAPQARISEITQEIVQAITASAAEVSGPIVITGHSAGGHLSARMRETGLLPDEVAHRVVRLVPISPLSDLAPLLRTDMNTDLNLDKTEARSESPVHLRDVLSVETLVWVGGAERPSFLDQARWLGEAWSCDVHIAGGKHHFDVIEAMEAEDGPLTNALVSGVT